MYRLTCIIILWIGWAECGVTRIDDQPGFRPGRIVNGEQVRNGEEVMKWQISLQLQMSANAQPFHFCGGTLIDYEWVLTAAHCVKKAYISPDNLVVAVNTTNFHMGNVSRIGVQRILAAEYNKTSKQNDIALLKLKYPVTTNAERFRAVSLPSSDFKAIGDCIVSGWGHTSSGGSGAAENLMAANVTIVDNEKCAQMFGDNYEILPGMICAGGGKTDACQGDSGGPLVCTNSNGESVISGVVSWGIGCATPDLPGVYSEVAYYADWINRTMSEN